MDNDHASAAIVPERSREVCLDLDAAGSRHADRLRTQCFVHAQIQA
jgi:hypothetical protein